MASLIKYAARWLAWQVSAHEEETTPSPARITFFSPDERLSA